MADTPEEDRGCHRQAWTSPRDAGPVGGLLGGKDPTGRFRSGSVTLYFWPTFVTNGCFTPPSPGGPCRSGKILANTLVVACYQPPGGTKTTPTSFPPSPGKRRASECLKPIFATTRYLFERPP